MPMDYNDVHCFDIELDQAEFEIVENAQNDMNDLREHEFVKILYAVASKAEK